ncbi:polynucleotide adenylyltransferase PcnB [Thiohalorhabdus methylotrophus]|uniref:Poly(A) polymerase I n=1 Tax=Thiohalorhabdus methylotrophus TaxID=3242694 RepID=A0ABV4TY78_9GAMM
MTQSSAADPRSENHEGGARIISRPEHGVSRQQICPNALKVLYRLHSQGYGAYLVGGSVRDLLLGREPKDFDIATDARPEEVAEVFRNCRLIGRRFRLAHVHFKGDIVEVATFRGSGTDPDGQDKVRTEDGLILRDNVYGTLEEDVFRRDFTVNALYYNIADFSVVDYVGGLEDLRAGRMRLIGDPETRYCEDPVRMLRAVRFAAKLGFFIDAGTAAPITQLSHLLEDVPAARLFEEVNKLFLSGTSVAAYQLLRRFRLFEWVFPETAALLGEEENNFPHTFLTQVFEDTDRRVREDLPVTPAFLFAALLWHPLERERRLLEEEEGYSPEDALQKGTGRVLRRQTRQVALPKRFAEGVREIWALQGRLERSRGKRALRLLGHPRFRAGFDFLALRGRSGEADPELVQWWKDLLDAPSSKRSKLVGIKGGGQGRSNDKQSA